MKKLNGGIYIVKGAKWHDDKNGNTYYTAQIYNTKGDVIKKMPYDYGYGSSYYDYSKRWLEANVRKNGKLKVLDMGAGNYTKNEVKYYQY